MGLRSDAIYLRGKRLKVDLEDTLGDHKTRLLALIDDLDSHLKCQLLLWGLDQVRGVQLGTHNCILLLVKYLLSLFGLTTNRMIQKF